MLMTCAWMETSSAETGSSQTINSGSTAKGARYAHALTLTAREFMRIAVRVLGIEPHKIKELYDSFLPLIAVWGKLMDIDRFPDNITDRHARIEARIGVLKYDLHFCGGKGAYRHG